MKAAVYNAPGGPDVLVYRDVPNPVVAPDEVLIQVEAIAVEGGDLIHRREQAPPQPDWIVGFAAAGTVRAVGAAVQHRRVGDRVTAFHLHGSHAEQWAVPATRTWLLPPNVDMAEAAALPIAFGTAHHALFARAQLQRGDWVLIQAAAGGVGLAAVQLAAQAGAQIVAVASGADRCERIEALGAHHVIDRQHRNVLTDILQLTAGRGVDVVLDPVGSTLPLSLQALAPEGRLVFVGNAGGGPLTVDLWSAMQSNQSLLGVFMGSQLERPAVHATIDRLLQALAAQRLRVLIDRRFPLADAVAAHHHAETAKPLGRVILTP